MPLNLKVHDYQKVPGQPNTVKLARVTPYLRVVHSEPDGKDENGRTIWSQQPPIFAQEGNYYTEGGDEVPYDEVPEWFWTEARKMLPDSREVYGIVLPEDKKTKRKSEKTEETEPVVSE